MEYLLVFITSLLLALALTPAAIFIAPKIGAVDIPKDNRRMHNIPMPRFGGSAIFVGATASIAIFLVPENPRMVGILICGALIYILGLVDDIRGMSAKVKFLGQVVVGCAAFGIGVRINFIQLFFAPESGYTFFSGLSALILTVAWIVGVTNTINLIDGLDGLASGVTIIASLSIAYAAFITSGQEAGSLSMLALAGAALGFLPFNFHPAKIFMGDGGALFLGFMFASLSIEGATKSATVVAIVAPVLVLGVPIFDTAFAILRRMINKRPIMEADKGHLHHRIMAAGFGQKRAVLMLYGISGVMGLAAVLLSDRLYVEAVALTVIAATLIYVFLTGSGDKK